MNHCYRSTDTIIAKDGSPGRYRDSEAVESSRLAETECSDMRARVVFAASALSTVNFRLTSPWPAASDVLGRCARGQIDVAKIEPARKELEDGQPEDARRRRRRLSCPIRRVAAE